MLLVLDRKGIQMKTILKLGRRFKYDKGVDLYLLNTYENYTHVGFLKFESFKAISTQTYSKGEVMNRVWRGFMKLAPYSSMNKNFFKAEKPLWFWWIFRGYWK
jgi:hypothetical protein